MIPVAQVVRAWLVDIVPPYVVIALVAAFLTALYCTRAARPGPCVDQSEMASSSGYSAVECHPQAAMSTEKVGSSGVLIRCTCPRDGGR